MKGLPKATSHSFTKVFGCMVLHLKGVLEGPSGGYVGVLGLAALGETNRL